MLRPIQVLSLVLLVALLAACGSADSTPAATLSPTAVSQATALPTGANNGSTATPAPMSTTAPPSATAVPPSATAVPSTETPAPPTATLAPPTASPIPATVTPAPVDLGTIRLSLEPVASGLQNPVGIASPADGSGRLFILEKRGVIRVVQGGAPAEAPFLDLTDRVGSSRSEQGLLGLAFHPDFETNGRFFVNYTDRNGDTVVSSLTVEPGAAQADPAGETVLLQVDQPAANHNGGHLAFGPDGMLYIGLGDGGGGGDTYGNGQNPRSLLGAMLRLDVDGGEPYAIPADNPFADGDDALPEIWAIGLRNPWRYSFDRATGDLYIADVGQNAYEEIHVQPASSGGGENYGWPIMEGQHCFRTENCNQSSLVLPVAEYSHAEGCSVTGGYVYRGQSYPALAGVYLLGDYCSGIIWGLAPVPDGSWQMARLLQTDIALASFGEDEAGELYVVDASGGGLYRLAAPPGPAD